MSIWMTNRTRRPSTCGNSRVENHQDEKKKKLKWGQTRTAKETVFLQEKLSTRLVFLEVFLHSPTAKSLWCVEIYFSFESGFQFLSPPWKRSPGNFGNSKNCQSCKSCGWLESSLEGGEETFRQRANNRLSTLSYGFQTPHFQAKAPAPPFKFN